MELGVSMTREHVPAGQGAKMASKRRLSVILALLALTACTGEPEAFRVGRLLFQSINGSQKIPRERAAAVPYATMGLELGSSAQVLLTLGTTTGKELDWFAGENIFVATSDGQVIRTVGLPYDLGGRHPIGVSAGHENKDLAAASTSSSMDFPDLGIFGATAECSSREKGEEQVEILGAPILTHHVVEHCNVQVLKWTFDNDYWRDRTSGYVWRSRQYVHPKSPPVILEVFRPEQNDQN